MDFDKSDLNKFEDKYGFNESPKMETKKNPLQTTGIFSDDDHSPSKFIDLNSSFPEVIKPLEKDISSDDFERFDKDVISSSTGVDYSDDKDFLSSDQKGKKTNNDFMDDDFFANSNSPSKNSKSPTTGGASKIDAQFSDYGMIDMNSSDLMGFADSKNSGDEKTSTSSSAAAIIMDPLKSFLDSERGFSGVENLPAKTKSSISFASSESPNKKIDHPLNKDGDNGDDDDNFLISSNSYDKQQQEQQQQQQQHIKSSPAKKLITEEKEKFISSEDLLLGDYKNEPKSEQLKEDLFNKGDGSRELSSKAKENVIPTSMNLPSSSISSSDGNKGKTSAQTSTTMESSSKKEKSTNDNSNEKPVQMISAEEMFYRFGLDAWFKPERLHPQVESLIYWRDIKKSGIVFGAGLIVLLAISCFSVISVFAYLSLLTLTGTVAFRIYKTVLGAIQKTSDGHPFKEFLEFDLTLSQDKAQQIVNVVVAHLNAFISELRRLFLVEDLVDSLKFGVVLWSLTYIGAWFNGITLVILAFVALFSLPKVYENNKQSIDTYLGLVRNKFLEITDKVKAAVPIGKKPETDKDK